MPSISAFPTIAHETDEVRFPIRRLHFEGSYLSLVDAGPREAEPLVLLHGYIGSHRVWRHLIEPLARTHRVIAPDWFGWGESGRPLDWDYSYEAEVARLVRVLDALGLDSVNLAGHDYGGFLALGLTAKEPERVRRLMILNSRAQGTFNAFWYAAFGVLSLLCRFPPTRAMLERLPLAALHRRSLAGLLKRGLFDEASLSTYVDWMRDDPDGPAWFTRFMGQYRVAVREDLKAALPEIRCPVSVIWGEPDAYIPTRVARELAEGIPGAELRLIPRASHFVMEHKPAETLEAALAWLGRPTGEHPKAPQAERVHAFS